MKEMEQMKILRSGLRVILWWWWLVDGWVDQPCIPSSCHNNCRHSQKLGIRRISPTPSFFPEPCWILSFRREWTPPHDSSRTIGR